jgi:transposase InsO family protein
MPAHRRDHRDLTAAIGRLRTELREQRRELQRLRMENEILRDAAEPLIHRAPARERFAFVHRRRGRFAIRRLRRILVTDPSNYHAWVKAKTCRDERGINEQELLAWITEIHTAHPAYGAERITRELKRHDVEVGRRRVARLMREHSIAGITRRRRRNLTKPDATAAAVPDLIRRECTAPMPGLKLVGDISCSPTSEGWLYLATVLDLCTKELIGYAIAPHMRASLAVDAITAAHRTGLVAGNAIMPRTAVANITREPTAMRYVVWRSGRAPAGAARVSTAPRQSPSSPPSRRRSASASSPTALPRAATSRTGSPTTTNDGCTPPSTTKPQPKPELPGNSACPPRHNPKWCPETCRLQMRTSTLSAPDTDAAESNAENLAVLDTAGIHFAAL